MFSNDDLKKQTITNNKYGAMNNGIGAETNNGINTLKHKSNKQISSKPLTRNRDATITRPEKGHIIKNGQITSAHITAIY